MQHPFAVLRPEYERLLATCSINSRDRDRVDDAARKLIGFMPRYVGAVAGMAVPPAEVAVLHERESDADFKTYLGNGEPLSRVTRLVPKGRGPWLDPNAWEKGAADAIRYDGLDDNSAPWSMPYGLWKGEGFNGFGPRNHGRHSGYVWACTSVYDGGKYTETPAGSRWNPEMWDQQIGIAALLIRIGEIAPQYAIIGMPQIVASAPAAPPLPVPEGVGGGGVDSVWIQHQLNVWSRRTVENESWYPLDEDGSYGRITRRAVREFQARNGLKADGLAGAVETIPALKKITA